jgi:hypothetical protein
MLRTLRAFAWMRWRVLMNSLERTSARDTVERLSLAIEQIGPIIGIALLAPSAGFLGAFGIYAGYWSISEDTVVSFEVVRLLLLVACGFSVLAPIIMPSLERTSAVRLLLLPIPARTLYVAQAAGAISEPWILLAIPAIVGVAIGLALRGLFGGTLVALAAGTLFVFVLIGLSAVATFVLQILFRDRRRGELLALLFIVVVPILGTLPGVLASGRTREQEREDSIAYAERQARGQATLGDRAWAAVYGAFELLPSELLATAARSSAHGAPAAALKPTAMLGIAGLVLHALGLLTFGRLLASPESSSPRQTARGPTLQHLNVPLLSRGSAAVAQGSLRLALRTPRGRSMILSPAIVFAMMAFMIKRGGAMDFGFLQLHSGLALATFGSALSLLSILPFAMNQFAIDRAGLTLSLIAPLSTRDLLIGKAAGNALVVAVPAILCMLLAYVLFPAGPPSLWLSLPLGLAATYVLAAPAAAALSAVFPRAINLNSIARASNAHGVAAMLGLVAFALAGLPPVLIAAGAIAFGRPAFAPFLIAGWLVIAVLVSHLLFAATAVLFEKRRENLTMVSR